MKYPFREIDISEIENVKIGNAEDLEHATGCTVIICENGMPAGVDVRGGGPASRETELLNPAATTDVIHAVLLSGGSAFGLDAAGGVMEYLAEKGIGFAVGDAEDFRTGAVMEELKRQFPPEFLNRLDEVVFFHRLDQPHLERIAGRLLGGLEGRLAALGVGLKADEKAVSLLATPTKDQERDQGARPIRRSVRRRVEEPAAQMLLSQDLQKGDVLCLGVEEEKLVLHREKKQV